jgi:hypothetical protein
MAQALVSVESTVNAGINTLSAYPIEFIDLPANP